MKTLVLLFTILATPAFAFADYARCYNERAHYPLEMSEYYYKRCIDEEKRREQLDLQHEELMDELRRQQLFR